MTSLIAADKANCLEKSKAVIILIFSTFYFDILTCRSRIGLVVSKFELCKVFLRLGLRPLFSFSVLINKIKSFCLSLEWILKPYFLLHN